MFLLPMLIDQSIIDIMSFLDTRVQDYFNFGIGLGINYDALSEMEYHFLGDAKCCIRRIFHIWRASSQDTSYQSVVKALKASEYTYLSEIIEEYFKIPRQVDLSTFEFTREG